MITLVLNSAREVKELIAKSRRQITNINGVNFGAIYPMLNASNTAVWYYSVPNQENEYLHAPFVVTINPLSFRKFYAG